MNQTGKSALQIDEIDKPNITNQQLNDNTDLREEYFVEKRSMFTIDDRYCHPTPSLPMHKLY